MHVVTQVWWLPKNGNSTEEYEDAFCPKQFAQKAVHFRRAVADGATETAFSRQWAQLLTRAYYKGQFKNDRLWLALPRLQRLWLKWVSAKSLPWYAEEKLHRGAFSSLIGLTLDTPIEGSEAGSWQALGIGDSCVFQIRNEELILRWPLDHSAQFGNNPILLSTKLERNVESSAQAISGEWERGDLFYLMTDAIAHWYLRRVEQGSAPGEVVPDFEQASLAMNFSDWIASLRELGQMRNDDVTLMRVVLK